MHLQYSFGWRQVTVLGNLLIILCLSGWKKFLWSVVVHYRGWDLKPAGLVASVETDTPKQTLSLCYIHFLRSTNLCNKAEPWAHQVLKSKNLLPFWFTLLIVESLSLCAFSNALPCSSWSAWYVCIKDALTWSTKGRLAHGLGFFFLLLMFVSLPWSCSRLLCIQTVFILAGYSEICGSLRWNWYVYTMIVLPI
jgi:hypothetical protein